MINEHSAKAVIEDGAIVIRVPIANLQSVLDGGFACNVYPHRYAITDPEGAAKEICAELNSEDDEGTTPVHRLFDCAIFEAIEQGSLCIEQREETDDSA